MMTDHRREELMQELSDGIVLVRGRAGIGLNASFFYLTGIAEPRGALLLAASGVRIGFGRMHPGADYVHGQQARQILFLPARDPLAAQWGEDAAATAESVSAEKSGVDAVLPATELEAVLDSCLSTASVLHLVRGTAPTLSGGADADASLATRISERFLNLDVRDASAAVHAMRAAKDDGEVAAIERAIEVTAEAFDRVLRSVRPGLQEHELEAEIARTYRAHGATHAFDPIVACGERALQLHYRNNRGPVSSGELLLVDSGASLDEYKADITRTYPVDGRFDERQRQVYEAVLAAQEAVIADCKPGVLLGDLHRRAYAVIDGAGFGEYFIHGTSHHLGLETHDVGDVHRPLAAGAVITVEPGIYLPEERLGVRIEDDVLITASGCRVLSEAIPKTIEEIERRMAGAA